MISGLLFYAGAALVVCAAWHLVPILWTAPNTCLIRWTPDEHRDAITTLRMQRACRRFASGVRAASSSRETHDGIEFLDANNVVVARLEGVLRPAVPQAKPLRLTKRLTIC